MDAAARAILPGMTLVGTTPPVATTGTVDLAISIGDLDVSLIEAVHGCCNGVTHRITGSEPLLSLDVTELCAMS